MNPYNCVDVSEHNKAIDWAAAAADDVKFAFIRAGFGQDYESQDDKYFHINIQDALDAGVKVGVYFYSYATSAEAAIGEAEHCCRLLEPYKDKISFPVFYDIEESKIESHLEEIVPAFINYLNDKGYNCGVYLSTSWFDDYFKDIDCDYFATVKSLAPEDRSYFDKMVTSASLITVSLEKEWVRLLRFPGENLLTAEKIVETLFPCLNRK